LARRIRSSAEKILIPINPFRLIPNYKPLRKKRAKPRRGPMRSLTYRIWLTKQGCLICLKLEIPQLGPTDPAHTENNGTSSKGPDSSCAPLCRHHHREYDAGREGFEKKYGINMRESAASYWRRFQMERSSVSR